jgi:hypothetical protein
MNAAPRNQVLFEYFKQKLTASSKHVYSPSDLTSLIAELRADFGFPQSIFAAKFQCSLIENGIMQEILFTATHPFESKRYHLGPFSPYELALSPRSGSYLSHGTAAYLHKLSEQTHRTIYLNKEQSPKDSTTSLTQPILEKLGQPKAGAHAFRRFPATWLRMQRTPEDLIGFWLGHANKTITDGYSLLKEDSQFRREIAEQVNIGFEIPASEPDVAPKIAICTQTTSLSTLS